ncbi:hypothetical protein CIT292_10513 [Citrobacter youngae ATCC 29220]|uniref:Uncharacterized protein n=1 Tax=Citrobacter youngae ATCC 29220 TaxID=500640 RepID=D4BIZ6_9ENTR|nr:hypothetical protein CIT292_10513 [Citrobacter youngae ATCC 29220]
MPVGAALIRPTRTVPVGRIRRLRRHPALSGTRNRYDHYRPH